MATKQVIHVRRCHVCGTVNEEMGATVNRCSHCGKHLAPFYFFEESRLEGVSDDQTEMSLWPEASGYRPLWGFSTFWSLESPQEIEAERKVISDGRAKIARQPRRHRRSAT